MNEYLVSAQEVVVYPEKLIKAETEEVANLTYQAMLDDLEPEPSNTDIQVILKSTKQQQEYQGLIERLEKLGWDNISETREKYSTKLAMPTYLVDITIKENSPTYFTLRVKENCDGGELIGQCDRVEAHEIMNELPKI